MAGDFGPHGALQNLVSVNYSLPKDEQGNLTIPSQAAADYLDEQPKIIPHDKTWREKTVDWAADKMMEYGASPQSAYKYSRKVFGGGNELMGIGVADVTPAGVVFAGEEAVRGYKEGDVVMPTVELALSAAEAYPLTKAILRPARKLFQASNAPVDESRRQFVKKAAGAGAAGAVGALKGFGNFSSEVIPVAEKAIAELPKNIFDVPSLLNFHRNLVNMNWIENFDMLDADDVKEYAEEGLDDLGKTFQDFGVEVGDHEGLLGNEKFLDETGLAIDAAIDFLEPDDLLKQDAGDILEWLDNKIGLDEISDSAGGAAFDVISELITKYKMSKPEIRKYLQENNILEGDI